MANSNPQFHRVVAEAKSHACEITPPASIRGWTD
jgi:hypothetical protein